MHTLEISVKKFTLSVSLAFASLHNVFIHPVLYEYVKPMREVLKGFFFLSFCLSLVLSIRFFIQCFLPLFLHLLPFLFRLSQEGPVTQSRFLLVSPLLSDKCQDCTADMLLLFLSPPFPINYSLINLSFYAIKSKTTTGR